MYLLTVMRPSLSAPLKCLAGPGTPQTTHYKFYLTIQMKLFKIMSLLGLVGWKQGPQSLSLPTPIHMLHLTYHNNYFHSQAPGYLHQLQLSTRTSTLPCQIPPCPAKVSHDLPYPIQPQYPSLNQYCSTVLINLQSCLYFNSVRFIAPLF